MSAISDKRDQLWRFMDLQNVVMVSLTICGLQTLCNDSLQPVAARRELLTCLFDRETEQSLLPITHLYEYRAFLNKYSTE